MLKNFFKLKLVSLESFSVNDGLSFLNSAKLFSEKFSNPAKIFQRKVLDKCLPVLLHIPPVLIPN